MAKLRLDQALVQKQLVSTRSQAENYIKLGYVFVDGKNVNKPGLLVSGQAIIKLNLDQQYVSRAALKLASVSDALELDFRGKNVLDVGSSTGGFTDYALKHRAKRIIAVDVGSQQMHPSLRANPAVELYEKTDIRDFQLPSSEIKVDIVLIDVSFISLREILPKVVDLVGVEAEIVAMVKPQFEAGRIEVNKGVVKNDSLRRKILRDFEDWAKKSFIIKAKADSGVAGSKGNLERFYLLRSKT